MTKPTRIQLRRAKGWRLPEKTVVVSRPTPWGNPFVVGVFGDAAKCVESYRALLEGTVCVSSPRVDIDEQLAVLRHVRGHLDELRGKNLACWCKIGQPCHADVLLDLANR